MIINLFVREMFVFAFALSDHKTPRICSYDAERSEQFRE
jgi:hypothetical protein